MRARLVGAPGARLGPLIIRERSQPHRGQSTHCSATPAVGDDESSRCRSARCAGAPRYGRQAPPHQRHGIAAAIIAASFSPVGPSAPRAPLGFGPRIAAVVFEDGGALAEFSVIGTGIEKRHSVTICGNARVFAPCIRHMWWHCGGECDGSKRLEIRRIARL